MRYAVTGADRDSGEDVTIVVEATDERVAREKANRKGILVSECAAANHPAAAIGRADTVSTAPAAKQAPAQTARSSWAAFIAKRCLIYLGIAVVFFGGTFCIWCFVRFMSGIEHSFDSSQTKTVPSIRVVDAVSGATDISVSFRDWRLDWTGYVLKGTMTWRGEERISALTYTVRDSGTVVARGDVNVPGDGMRRNEAVEVWFNIHRDVSPSLEVVIEVMH